MSATMKDGEQSIGLRLWPISLSKCSGRAHLSSLRLPRNPRTFLELDSNPQVRKGQSLVFLCACVFLPLVSDPGEEGDRRPRDFRFPFKRVQNWIWTIM